MVSRQNNAMSTISPAFLWKCLWCHSAEFYNMRLRVSSKGVVRLTGLKTYCHVVTVVYSWRAVCNWCTVMNIIKWSFLIIIFSLFINHYHKFVSRSLGFHGVCLGCVGVKQCIEHFLQAKYKSVVCSQRHQYWTRLWCHTNGNHESLPSTF
jgi:hypothetical protein